MSRPRIPLDARSFLWSEHPWPNAFELARLLPPSSWTLIGGLMVQLHAAIADLPTSRVTTDVDTALHLETRSVTFPEVVVKLQSVGFTLDPATAFAYRFTRGNERVDVLCADRYASFRKPRYRGRPLFGVPGGTRALQRTIDLDIRTNDDTVRMVVPALQGALVLKGAAFLEDSRDRTRHLEDGILLLACVIEVEEVVGGLSQRSRRRLRALTRGLSENEAPWAVHSSGVRALAQESLDELREVLSR